MYDIPDQLHREITIDAPQQRVWDALTSSALLAKWFSTEIAEVDLTPGGRCRFVWEDGANDGFVRVVEPISRFAYDWRLSNTDRPYTRVTFELERSGDSTVLTVTETGFASLPEDVREQAYDGNSSGWRAELSDLVDLLVAA